MTCKKFGLKGFIYFQRFDKGGEMGNTNPE